MIKKSRSSDHEMLTGNIVRVNCTDGNVDIPCGMINQWSVYSELKDNTLVLDCSINNLTDVIEHEVLIKRCSDIKLPDDIVFYFEIHTLLYVSIF